MKDLSISLIQTTLAWEDPAANRSHFEQKIKALDNKTDLILLPEMFTTGFTMNSKKVAEAMEGPSMEWMHQQADLRKAVVCGSLIIKENKHYYNRLIWMQPNGQYGQYDKHHLFRMANEDQSFTAGTNKLIVELKGWKVCPLICYDLRFPVFSRNHFETDRQTYAEAEYDLLLYVANWPAPRVEAWKKLLFARAIENQAYVAGVNRIGEDGNQVNYSGGSCLVGPKGDALWQAQNEQEELVSLNLSAADLIAFRKKFPVGMDADDFELKD